MTQETPDITHKVCEMVLGWIHAPEAQVLAAQVAGWREAQWEAARWAIQVHGIAPLLHQRLRDRPVWAHLAPSLQTYLADQHRFTGQRVTRLMTELSGLLQAAAKSGVEVVPLKGSVLVTRYYDDPALRQMSDLDILVRSTDETRLMQVLTDLGYQMVENTPRHRSFAPAGSRQQVVYADGDHPDNPYHLDLHSEIQERFWGVSYRLTDEAWASCRPALFGTAPGLLLGPLALLQHLLIHTSRDAMVGRVRFIQLYDIALVGKRLSDAEWGDLVEAGVHRGEERLLFLPLWLTERYVGRVAPPEVLARLAEGTPASLHAFLTRADLYYLSFCNPQPMSFRDKVSLFRPGRERVLMLRYRLLPTPHELRDLYPRLARSYLVPAAYLVHALRILVWPVRQKLRLPRLSWIRRDRGGKW